MFVLQILRVTLLELGGLINLEIKKKNKRGKCCVYCLTLFMWLLFFQNKRSIMMPPFANICSAYVVRILKTIFRVHVLIGCTLWFPNDCTIYFLFILEFNLEVTQDMVAIVSNHNLFPSSSHCSTPSLFILKDCHCAK